VITPAIRCGKGERELAGGAQQLGARFGADKQLTNRIDIAFDTIAQQRWLSGDDRPRSVFPSFARDQFAGRAAHIWPAGGSIFTWLRLPAA